MQKRNVHGALKILTSNMSRGIFPLMDEIFQFRVKTSWCKRHLPTGVTTRTNTKNAPNCVWRHWRRTNKKAAIRVGEVYRKISGKVIMMISKQYVMKVAGSLQVCAWQEAAAAIQAVYNIFKDHTTEATLLTDAENAFNAINRKTITSSYLSYMSYYIYLHK